MPVSATLRAICDGCGVVYEETRKGEEVDGGDIFRFPLMPAGAPEGSEWLPVYGTEEVICPTCYAAYSESIAPAEAACAPLIDALGVMYEELEKARRAVRKAHPIPTTADWLAARRAT